VYLGLPENNPKVLHAKAMHAERFHMSK